MHRFSVLKNENAQSPAVHLGLLGGLAIVPVSLSLSPASESPADREVEKMAVELLLPEGVSMEATVRKLWEYDRKIKEEHSLTI